ncbi:MAG: hypothetical protein ABIO70_02550 [Pseudomonadota bacterium]
MGVALGRVGLQDGRHRLVEDVPDLAGGHDGLQVLPRKAADGRQRRQDALELVDGQLVVRARHDEAARGEEALALLVER